MVKAQVVLEAIRGEKTLNEIAREYGGHPTLVGSGSESFRRMQPACLRVSEARNRRIQQETPRNCTPR
jgi:transposase-like protein